MKTWRAWLCGGLAGMLVACGTQANVPDQPQGDTQVIVIGAPSKQQQPQQVAESEPEPVIAELSIPANKVTDTDLVELVMDPRKARWEPRAAQLLITELQSLEALFASVPPNAPDRPKIMRRLAEDYYELASRGGRDKQAARERSARGDMGAAREIEKSDRLIPAAQRKMTDYYEMLTQNHPNFCHSPNAADPTKSRGCNDEALYFLGLEYQRLASPEKARKTYLTLIMRFPASPWIPSAYVAFGEFFFAEGNTDPSKLEYARQSYDKAVQFPPPQNEVLGFAHYRLAQVHKQKQDHPAAMSHLMKAIDFAVNNPHLRSSPALAQAARREIVPVYAAAGAPTKAEPFFKRFLDDPSTPGINGQLVDMLDALVQTYVRENKRAEANEVCNSFSGGVAAIPACRNVNSAAGQQVP